MMNRITIGLANRNGIVRDIYGQQVNREMRKTYTVSREIAIIRQKDRDPERFEQYNRDADRATETVKERMIALGARL